MRLFLAIPLSDEARHAAVHHLKSHLDHPLPGRPVRPELWHLTLRFLGEVDEVGADRVTREVDEAERGAGFTLRWGALGAFPRPRRANVLWLGLERGEAEAERLAAVVEEAVEAAGSPPEDRPFRSHLTLSRIRPDQDVTAVLEAVPALGLDMAVNRVVLYRSHLGRGGPRYEEMEAFPLA
ncbi:MAG: RNA 2',3'-cyclic phosphodiesterase [Acidimicrobiia bacterium]|nr:RNA 2',3'-cyclic phosphodiesterase [Acidimicrobiia bacterium]